MNWVDTVFYDAHVLMISPRVLMQFHYYRKIGKRLKFPISKTIMLPSAVSKSQQTQEGISIKRLDSFCLIIPICTFSQNLWNDACPRLPRANVAILAGCCLELHDLLQQRCLGPDCFNWCHSRSTNSSAWVFTKKWFTTVVS